MSDCSTNALKPKKPLVTRCALCRFWRETGWPSADSGSWCARYNAPMGRHDGCTKGEENDED